ncbi:copper ion transmembrane transporter [Tasmannia lanceolata]|uniref:copper ion transmembrane transporter n=1 Tax=Tasmannia lanceolata TaxID=3420 RepID=UPI0040649118
MSSMLGTSVAIPGICRDFSSLRVSTGPQWIRIPSQIPSPLIQTSTLFPSKTIRMGGGPRTYPGGVSKWQWKHMQAKKAKQLLKARLCRERQIYEMRKRAELKAAVSELEKPWEVVERAPALFSVKADEQLKVLADRFQRPGGYDLWSERDGPQIFHTADGLPSARFFPKGVVHSIKPYGKIAGLKEDSDVTEDVEEELGLESVGGGGLSNSVGRGRNGFRRLRRNSNGRVRGGFDVNGDAKMGGLVSRETNRVIEVRSYSRNSMDLSREEGRHVKVEDDSDVLEDDSELGLDSVGRGGLSRSIGRGRNGFRRLRRDSNGRVRGGFDVNGDDNIGDLVSRETNRVNEAPPYSRNSMALSRGGRQMKVEDDIKDRRKTRGKGRRYNDHDGRGFARSNLERENDLEIDGHGGLYRGRDKKGFSYGSSRNNGNQWGSGSEDLYGSDSKKASMGKEDGGRIPFARGRRNNYNNHRFNAGKVRRQP